MLSETIFGISFLGVAASIVLGILGIFITGLGSVAAIIFMVSFVVMFLTFLIDSAFYFMS